MAKFKVFSMFDGVGGFIVGLDHANQAMKKDFYQTTYSNQYEPSRKAQDAYEVGVYRFPEMNHSNQDIMEVPNSYFDEMKQNGVNMIVGGFPCQDYSVARSKSMEMGIEGKKGVLFWEIIRAVNHIQPEYLILENVDRLLKSPSKQRGRDFAIMLGAFNQLGYSVEWRVINAAEYGRAQRRRRVFFFVYRNDTKWAKKLDKQYESQQVSNDLFGMDFDKALYNPYIFKEGLFARQFPIVDKPYKNRSYAQQLSTVGDVKSPEYIVDISDNFTGTIWNTGVMRYGKYYTIDTKPVELPKDAGLTLGDVIQTAKDTFVKEQGEAAYQAYLDDFVIEDEAKLEKFKYLRGPKKIPRKTADGHEWIYSEGGMAPYDALDLPSRTMLTSEGSVNRSTHLIKMSDDWFRLLTPQEAELLQDFPVDWTKYKQQSDGKVVEVSNRMRMFFMGNALVTGIVKRIGIELEKIDSE